MTRKLFFLSAGKIRVYQCTRYICIPAKETLSSFFSRSDVIVIKSLWIKILIVHQAESEGVPCSATYINNVHIDVLCLSHFWIWQLTEKSIGKNQLKINHYWTHCKCLPILFERDQGSWGCDVDVGIPSWHHFPQRWGIPQSELCLLWNLKVCPQQIPCVHRGSLYHP